MAWKVQKVDAVTKSGKKATFIKYNDRAWPCPWVFRVDGIEANAHYSIGGFRNNHCDVSQPTDLVGPWSDHAAIIAANKSDQIIKEIEALPNIDWGKGPNPDLLILTAGELKTIIERNVT